MHKVLLIFTLLFSTSCTQKYFEGKITYSIVTKYKGDNERHKQFYENEKFGDKVIMYTNEEGFERKEFPNSKKYGPSFYLYNPKTNMQYAGYNFTDTIYYYRADFNILVDTEIEEIGKYNSTVLGKELMGIAISDLDTFQNIRLKSRYYYPAERLPINTKNWTKNKDFSRGEMYRRSQSHWLLLQVDYGNYEYEMTAVTIDTQEVDNSLFEIPSGRPLKFQQP